MQANKLYAAIKTAKEKLCKSVHASKTPEGGDLRGFFFGISVGQNRVLPLVCNAHGGSPCGRTRFSPTIKQLISYKQKRSGNNILQIIFPTSIFNFPFSTFNFKKLPLGHNVFLILQTVFTNGVQRHAAGGSPSIFNSTNSFRLCD